MVILLKRKVLFLIIIVLFFKASLAQPEWNNVNVLQINREQPHTTMMVFDSKDEALKWVWEAPTAGMSKRTHWSNIGLVTRIIPILST